MDDPEDLDRRPVPDQTRGEVLEPFIAAACSTLAELAQATVEVGAVYATSTPRCSGDIAVALDLTPTPGAMLVLDFPGPTASALADRVLAGGGGAVDDALVRDCMGEIANVIAGQAKALLHGTTHAFAFSTPRVMPAGDFVSGPGPGREFLVVVFEGDAGGFTMSVRPATAKA